MVTFIVACFLFFPFPSWAKMVGFITSGTVISFGSGPVTVAALRRQLPNQERPFRLPGGDILPFLGFLAANLIVFWTGLDTNWKLFLAMVLGYVVLGLHYAVQRPQQDPAAAVQIRLVDDPGGSAVWPCSAC